MFVLYSVPWQVVRLVMVGSHSKGLSIPRFCCCTSSNDGFVIEIENARIARWGTRRGTENWGISLFRFCSPRFEARELRGSRESISVKVAYVRSVLHGSGCRRSS